MGNKLYYPFDLEFLRVLTATAEVMAHGELSFIGALEIFKQGLEDSLRRFATRGSPHFYCTQARCEWFPLNDRAQRRGPGSYERNTRNAPRPGGGEGRMNATGAASVG